MAEMMLFFGECAVIVVWRFGCNRAWNTKTFCGRRFMDVLNQLFADVT